MRRLMILRCLSLLIVAVAAIPLPCMVLAQDNDDEYTIKEELIITIKYPKVEITAGQIAEFEVDLRLAGEIGGEARIFDLLVTAPKDWGTFISPTYPKDKKIASIQLKPGYGYGEKINIMAAPAYWLRPEPGEHPITLEATSGDIKETFTLLVVIKAKYVLDVVPAAARYHTTAKAGKDNYFSIEVQNNGSAAIDDIALSASKPEEWLVEFNPHDIDSLATDDFQTVDVNIKPPAEAVAGDYMITMKASGKQATTKDINIRVKVETPTFWGWLSFIIVVVVIAGLAFTFRKFSRR